MSIRTRNIKTIFLAITTLCILQLWTIDRVDAKKKIRIEGSDQANVVAQKNGLKEYELSLVPLRETFRTINASIVWDETTQTVRATDGKNFILVTVGVSIAIINHQAVKLDVPAKIVNQTIYVPIRFINETLLTFVTSQANKTTVPITNTSTNALERKTIPQIATLGRSIFLIESYNAKNELIGTGSGFLLTDNGIIATNFHVIRDATIIRVIDVSQNRYIANQLLYTNESRDLAMITVSETIQLPKLTLGDSENITIGDDIVTIGSPKGLQNTVSSGIISGLRVFDGQELIQITAPITFGSSGGALFDMYGNVIGITSSGIDAHGNLNFAIPINDVKKVINSLPDS